MNNEELIQEFIQGNLSPKELQAFDDKVKTDPSFAQELKDFKDLKVAIKTTEQTALKEFLQEIDTKEQPNDASDEIPSFGKRYRHIYAAAAIIIFAIIAFQFISDEPSTQDLYASFYQPHPNTLKPIVRGESNEEILTQAFISYEAGQFEKAADQFEQSLSQKYDPDVAFYKAITYLHTGKQKEALQTLSHLKEKNSSYEPQLYWYSALIALNNNDKTEALKQLDSLAALKTDYKKRAILKLKKHLTD